MWLRPERLGANLPSPCTQVLEVPVMIRRLVVIVLLAVSALLVNTSTTEAGWRRRCRRHYVARPYYRAPVYRAYYGPYYGYGYGPRVHFGVGIGYYGGW